MIGLPFDWCYAECLGFPLSISSFPWLFLHRYIDTKGIARNQSSFHLAALPSCEGRAFDDGVEPGLVLGPAHGAEQQRVKGDRPEVRLGEGRQQGWIHAAPARTERKRTKGEMGWPCPGPAVEWLVRPIALRTCAPIVPK